MKLINKIEYNEKELKLVIQTNSNMAQQALVKELKHVSEELVRERGTSREVTVVSQEEKNISLQGNLAAALSHLVCREYVDEKTAAMLRAKIAVSQHNPFSLIGGEMKSSSPKAATTQSPDINTNENVVILHQILGNGGSW